MSTKTLLTPHEAADVAITLYLSIGNPNAIIGFRKDGAIVSNLGPNAQIIDTVLLRNPSIPDELDDEFMRRLALEFGNIKTVEWGRRSFASGDLR